MTTIEIKSSHYLFICLENGVTMIPKLRLLTLIFASFSLFPKFVDMTINLNSILQTTRIQKHFPLSVFVFIVFTSQDASGHTLSRQNNLTFGIGVHEVGVRTVSVRTLRRNQIFLLSQVTAADQYQLTVSHLARGSSAIAVKSQHEMQNHTVYT